MWIEKLTGSLDDKRRWRAYKRRIAALPDGYRTAVEGIERYLLYTGGVTDGSLMMTMLDDLADLFERAAADGTPIRDVVGAEPAEFVQAFVANYSDGGWMAKEQRRLNDAIARAAQERGES
jgi:DNA-binding ferritin-like protein (Dps family)